MKSFQRILPLGLLAFVVLMLGLWMSSSEQGNLQGDRLLVPSLSNWGSEVTQVSVLNHQGVLLSASKKESGWQVDNVDGTYSYPMNRQKLAALLQSLADAEIVEAKTRNPENYQHLGLEDIEQPDTQALQLKLEGGNNSLSLLVGKSASSGNGQYVRFVGDEQSWLIDAILPLPFSVEDWLQQPILALSDNAIRSIELRSDSGKQLWHIYKNDAESSEFQLTNMPDGRSLSYPAVLTSMARSVAQLNFESVARLDDRNELALSNSLLVETFDEQQFELTLSADDEGQHYVQVKSDSAAGYWHSWRYSISHYAFKQITKSVDDFLAPDTENKIEDQAIDEGQAPK